MKLSSPAPSVPGEVHHSASSVPVDNAEAVVPALRQRALAPGGRLYGLAAAAAVGDAQKTLYIAGITYSLSKRTTLYAEIDRTRLEGGLASGGTTKLNQTRQSGMAAGIMHTF